MCICIVKDELTPDNVIHGFTSSPQLPINDEFGSAHECDISVSKVCCVQLFLPM